MFLNREMLFPFGNRRLVSLFGTAIFCFVLLMFINIPKRDAIIATVSNKAPQVRPAMPPTSAQQEQQLKQDRLATAAPITPPPPVKKHASVFEAASNRTLGLDSIAFINLPHRHDRFDAMAIQSHLAGIQITRYPAVGVSELEDQGLPPTEKPGKLKPQEVGVWRAHANIWRHMLEHQIPAVLVLESDASWDVNLRNISAHLNGGFRELLRQHNPDVVFEDDPDDPWLARTGVWDMLSVGHCYDSMNFNYNYLAYDDPFAPNVDYQFLDVTINRKRVVYRAQSIICTTGYIISLSGAARLLVRSTFNLDDPIDVMMAIMTERGELRTYSQQQKIIAQWAYIPGIGKTGGNSDIQVGDAAVKNGTKEGWDRAKKDRSSVEVRQDGYADTNFVDFALARAWEHIIGN